MERPTVGAPAPTPPVRAPLRTLLGMARVRLFASVREAAGRAEDDVPGATVGDVLDAAVDRYGPDFGRLLAQCRVWVNGEPVTPESPVGDHDELAVLPPVSGG